MVVKSVEDRIKEFVDYHIHGDGECNNVVLRAWADKHTRGLQEKYELAYFFAITYCVESAVILFEEREKVFADINGWVAENKQNLVFQSDRKYIRMKDSFKKCLMAFESIRDVNEFLQKVSVSGTIALGKAIPYVSSWVMFGRFSAFLFLETFVALTDTPIENATIEWKKGNTATSGLLNVFELDDLAVLFDKTGKLRMTDEQMDKMLSILLAHIARAGGETNVTMVETSLCAYRKFFKASRYNGFYLDRMLEEIYKMQPRYPAQSTELLAIRRQHFDPKYLGEVSGWRGVRPYMKKVYLETGIVT